MRIWRFPIELVSKEDKIVIWGFGEFGKALYKDIVKYDLAELVMIVDKDYINKGNLSIEIHNPELLRNRTDIIVLIAIMNVKQAILVKEECLEMGIPEKQIIWNENNNYICDINIESDIKQKIYDVENDSLNETLMQIKELLRVYSVKNAEEKFVRLGKENDGGYVMYDYFPTDKCKIAYSFGISNDVSWDLDMASKDYDIFMYDHTISKLPEENSKFHWKKKGIDDGGKAWGLIHYPKDDLENLTDIIRDNGHIGVEHMIMKMDIEYAEWGMIEMTDSKVFSQFDQIVMEIHGFNSKTILPEIVKGLEKINKTHRLVHIHPNNFCSNILRTKDGTQWVTAYEVTFIRKDVFDFYIDEDLKLPRLIDQKCDVFKDDIECGYWNK